MRVYQTRGFARWAEREGLPEAALCRATKEMEAGLIGVELGGSLVKKRIAAPGRGKSGGYRTIIAFRTGKHAFFLYGFAKNERDNIEPQELAALKKLSKQYLGYGEAELAIAVQAGALREVMCDE